MWPFSHQLVVSTGAIDHTSPAKATRTTIPIPTTINFAKQTTPPFQFLGPAQHEPRACIRDWGLFVISSGANHRNHSMCAQSSGNVMDPPPPTDRPPCLNSASLQLPGRQALCPGQAGKVGATEDESIWALVGWLGLVGLGWGSGVGRELQYQIMRSTC